jgi:16S rRNA (guanine966-N2)-methyltransferase
MAGLRVISGLARGKRLRSVPGDTTRPITDRVKEALFNIIGADISHASFLDLFAGTGSVGIEALSRGADFARLIDNNLRAIKTIRSNLEITGLMRKGQVITGSAFELLTRKPDQSFDYIYVAPPQYKHLWKRALLLLDANTGWLTQDGWVIVQIHPVEYENMMIGGRLEKIIEFDQRKYGSTVLVFYQFPNQE